ncbi:MAG: substrate-binding domain-containing protein [Pirellula sp.]
MSEPFLPRVFDAGCPSMKHLCSLWLFSLATVLFAVGCNQPTDKKSADSVATGGAAGTKRLIFVVNTDDPFWDACRKGLETADKDLGLAELGYKALMEVPDGSIKGQIDKLRQIGTQSDVAAVAVSAISADNPSIASELEQLKAKDIKVITVDGDMLHSKYRATRKYYIGTDNIIAGRELGKAAQKLLSSKGVATGGYVQFVGYTDNDNARRRMDGFKAGVTEAFNEIDRVSDETDLSRAQENVRNAIQNHQKDLVALVGIWAYNAPAIAKAVKAAKVKDKTVVVTFDAQEQAIRDMEEGFIDAMMVQNPFDMGYQAVRLMKAMVTNDAATEKEMFPNIDQENGDIYTTGLRVVVPNTGSPLTKDDFDTKVVEFMTLDQFKEWLAKYGLKSS